MIRMLLLNFGRVTVCVREEWGDVTYDVRSDMP